MSFDDVIGQQYAKIQIEAWLQSGRVPHAILFNGPPGTGKRRLALALSKALNCREAGVMACGHCSSCRRINNLVHPDLHVLAPLAPRRGKSHSTNPHEEMRQAVQDYLQEDDASSRGNVNIAREYLDQLQRDMGYAPVEGPYKIALILDAEAMHPAGANTLLKTLEEPSGNAVFILVSGASERLLPTILSRCQSVSLRRLNQAELRRRMQETGVDPQRAAVAARLGGGSLQQAVKIAEGSLDDVRSWAEQFLSAAAQGEDGVYWELLDEMGVRTGREQLNLFLEVCSSYLRDLFLLSLACESELAHLDRLEWLRQIQANFSREQIEAAAVEVDRAAENLRRNVNANIVLADLWRYLRRRRLRPATRMG